MNLLAEIRASGGVVELLPGSQFRVVGVSPELRAQLAANRDAVSETLREESLFGIQYCDSAYYVTVSNLYDAATSCKSHESLREDAGRLLVICREIDDAMSLAMDRGLEVLDGHRAEIERLADQIAVRSGYLLAGAALHREAKAVFADVNEDVLAA